MNLSFWKKEKSLDDVMREANERRGMTMTFQCCKQVVQLIYGTNQIITLQISMNKLYLEEN